MYVYGQRGRLCVMEHDGSTSGMEAHGPAAAVPRSSSSTDSSNVSNGSDHNISSINSSSSRLQEISLVRPMVSALVPQAHCVC